MKTQSLTRSAFASFYDVSKFDREKKGDDDHCLRFETSSWILLSRKKKSRYNVTVPVQKVMSFSLELVLQHRFETVLDL
jgi:hypothetical protein